METTFITIHDLSAQGHLLYASDSIVDILGYVPQDVIGRSCFDYFHPEEIPWARSVHGRGVRLDKAAVLSYCRIKSKVGEWVGCECCFTVVYDVLVACTSIYRRGMKSQSRAVEAPIIRRLFSSSPKDPRYHMLSHLSTKFTQHPSVQNHEPRAALFLNRFTRTLTIMYATTALSTVLGVTADEANGKSFYECIQENCLPEAIRCLEGAKANDSIAYMRFWFRDPRQEDQQDEAMTDAVSSSDEDEDGGVHLDGHFDPTHSDGSSYQDRDAGQNSRSSSGDSTDLEGTSRHAIFGRSKGSDSSASSLPSSADGQDQGSPTRRQQAFEPPGAPIEIEAVVSCTSDGLVVILRRARPIIPDAADPTAAPVEYRNGLFASPWAAPPIMPPASVAQQAFTGSFLPDLAAAQQGAPIKSASGGAGSDTFMRSIREVAVFAWSLTGINGSLAQYGRGKPTGESQPPDGFPIWDPTYRSIDPKGDPDARRYHEHSTSRDDSWDNISPNTAYHPQPDETEPRYQPQLPSPHDWNQAPRDGGYLQSVEENARSHPAQMASHDPPDQAPPEYGHESHVDDGSPNHQLPRMSHPSLDQASPEYGYQSPVDESSKPYQPFSGSHHALSQAPPQYGHEPNIDDNAKPHQPSPASYHSTNQASPEHGYESNVGDNNANPYQPQSFPHDSWNQAPSQPAYQPSVDEKASIFQPSTDSHQSLHQASPDHGYQTQVDGDAKPSESTLGAHDSWNQPPQEQSYNPPILQSTTSDQNRSLVGDAGKLVGAEPGYQPNADSMTVDQSGSTNDPMNLAPADAGDQPNVNESRGTNQFHTFF
ncbi:MAG: hypothetical protein M1837_006384 [Sclerophora amabilis]|nr:MAG: hypothetical protein M1837_006384 [Sclerophora amabilis]